MAAVDWKASGRAGDVGGERMYSGRSFLEFLF